MKPVFTEHELSQVAHAIHEYIFALVEEGKYEDDSVLFAIRDYINLYDKVADYHTDDI